MEVHLTAEIEEKLNDLASRSGRPAANSRRMLSPGFVDELAGTRDMLDRRYDDIKAGKVALIPGEEVEAQFRAKSAAARRSNLGA